MADANTPATELPADEPSSSPGGIPLYVWVLAAVALAIPAGMALGVDASWADRLPGWLIVVLKIVAVGLDLAPKLIIKALAALAAPLVVLAILSAIVTNDIHGRQGLRMMVYYLVNTVLAMVFGLTLSNLIRPGVGAELAGPAAAGEAPARLVYVLAPLTTRSVTPPEPRSFVDILSEFVPRSVGEPFVTNNLAQLVLLTLALSIALTALRNRQRARGETAYQSVVDLVTVGFELFMRVLLWVVAAVPLAVFGVVAMSIARQGFDMFLNLGWFIVVVLMGLGCQLILYLSEVGLIGRITPWRFLGSARNVMATTFSTASTAATIPITLNALTEKLKISRSSSYLTACVGTNFNNDGTALYQASAALFFAQALGGELPLTAQLVIVLTTLIASVGAGGIPSGSFVTMPLIFAAVDLPADKLPILLTIDWFLDRCRTTSNVLGDMTVAVLLERTASAEPSSGELPESCEPQPAATGSPEGAPESA